MYTSYSKCTDTKIKNVKYETFSTQCSDFDTDGYCICIDNKNAFLNTRCVTTCPENYFASNYKC